MNKKAILTILGIIVIILGGILAVNYFSAPATGTDLTEFAQCLSAKDTTMYGAYWCTHCQAQKALFGEAFKYVPYVECTEDANKCLEKGVSKFPTWIIKGEKLEGEQTLQLLSEKTGCELPED